MAFFIDLGEEITGDALDMEGDEKRGSRSIAKLKGKQICPEPGCSDVGNSNSAGSDPHHAGVDGYCISDHHPGGGRFDHFLFDSAYPYRQRKYTAPSMRGIYIGATLIIAAFLIGQIID